MKKENVGNNFVDKLLAACSGNSFPSQEYGLSLSRNGRPSAGVLNWKKVLHLPLIWLH